MAQFALNQTRLPQVVKTFGTPLFIYESKIIRANYQKLRHALPKQVEIFYSIKANPNLTICAYLASLGAGLEVCSPIELEIAAKIIHHHEKIIFIGPMKSPESLKKAIRLNRVTLFVESLTELARINQLGKEINKVIPIVLRLNPDFHAESAQLKMSGKPTQFGIDIEELLTHEKQILASEHIHLSGIHIYHGSRILDASTIAKNTENILKLAEELMQKWQKKFSIVGIGGGLGIPYFAGEKTLDLDELSQLIEPIIKSFSQNNPTCRILLESGRYLVGEAGTFVTRVDNIKKTKGETFAITDGGMNCHMATTGQGSFIRRHFPIHVYQEKECQEKSEYTITGPLCTPNDMMAKKIQLPILESGDLILVKSSGAYGPTASPTLFLSHGYPAEVFIHNQRAYLIHKRENYKDILAKQPLFHLV